MGRFDRIGQLLQDDAAAGAEDALRWIEATRAELTIPGLGAFGVDPAEYDEIVEKSSVSSSMKGNPITLSAEELRAILAAAH